MALSDDESAAMSFLTRKLGDTWTADSTHDAYYEGTQRLDRLGIAVPPELATLRTVVNWPRLCVDALEERCDLKSFIRPGASTSDAGLREGWDANNLDSEFHLAFVDMLVLGRGFLSVGTNDSDTEHPIIAVESPREAAVDINPRTREVRSALKLYGAESHGAFAGIPKYATLMLPNETIWLERQSGSGEWVDVDRDQHNIGSVPMFPFFNRRRSGRWHGVSEIADAISLTDAAARALTNLQVAAETHSVPQRWVLGVSKSDFVGADGNPLPAWQAYFTSIWANQSPDAKVGQFASSDLKNFHDTVEHYAGLLAGLYGLPIRYFGQNSANPPSADGIRADESRLIKRAERKMSYVGDQLGRVMATYERFRTGEWPGSGDLIKVEWFDAATPTEAAKADKILKLNGGASVLSREGSWDELGWSDARKNREREYFATEASDPILERLTREMTTDAAPGVG